MTEGAQYKHFSEVLQCIKGKRLLKVRRAVRALAAALDPLLGRRVIRVLSVGKEIFFVFEEPKRPGQEDQALKIHFGDGPGYQYESAEGEIWGMVKRSSRRQPLPETELEFDGCRFRLWEDHNFYSHLYNVVDFGYVHTVEHRRHRDIASENLSKYTNEIVSLLRRKDGYIVDWIMDQTILPGVGNIMKSEGLFNARVHPLRKCKSLTNEELRIVVEELNRFALTWYHLCKRTGEGAPHTAAHASADHSEKLLAKQCYGEVDCPKCGREVFCIKLGTRQRITYFCNGCQTPGNSHQPLRRKHKLEMPLPLPLCHCRQPARIMHVYHYGRDHGRIFFACRKAHQHKGRCRFKSFLDQSNFDFPRCRCQPSEKMLLRRVMGLADNGRYFAQCASKRCKHRIWMVPTVEKSSGVKKPSPPEECPDERRESRWSRHKRISPNFEQECSSNSYDEPRTRLFIQRSVTGEFIHGREGLAQTGKHLLGVPDGKGVVQTPSNLDEEENLGSGTCTPVTSGAEELLDDEEELRETPPDMSLFYERRWRQDKVGKTCQRSKSYEEEQYGDSFFAEKIALMDLFPSVSPVLLEEFLAEEMTFEQIVDFLSTSDGEAFFA
mmetsp:Transcript_107395/g.206520  ORF Transcript_107395/g.206520 Transcript_107395/m.206520 type:complete len:608 (+) Transcript_107395:75-1898(+)